MSRCEHLDVSVYMLDHEEECVMFCKECNATRKGHVVWAEWVKEREH